MKKFSSKDLDAFDSNTGSSKSMELARLWIQTCRDTHDKCASYCGNVVPQLPTRVLDVGQPGSSSDPSLYLSHGQTGSYVALSHCWGKSQPIITTSSNLVKMQQSIPFASLSRTFQDAIITTKALGERYLWIDSLCIIQDDREDWDIESSRMGDIYRHAVCTISAVKSADGNGGCFAARDPRVHRPIYLRVNGINSQKAAENGELDPNETMWYPYRWVRPTGPLYQRAWVFQEQALSGRSISFTAESVHWTCLTTTASECRPVGYSSKVNEGSHFQLFQKLLLRSSQSIEKSEERHSKRDVYDIWFDMVSDYSRRDLTNETDKLVAISALADYMSRILDDKYAAGLWHRDMLRGLLWTCQQDDGKRCTPPELYIAPSWSWASIRDAAITLDFAKKFGDGIELMNTYLMTGQDTSDNGSEELLESELRHPLEQDDWGDPDYGIEILDIRCTLSGRNVFGQIIDGSITLAGWVRMGVVSLATQDLLDLDTDNVMGGLNFDELPGEDFDRTIVSCLFMTWREMPQTDEEPQSSVCLALLPTGLCNNEYRRIGLAGIEAQYWDYDCEWKQIVLV